MPAAEHKDFGHTDYTMSAVNEWGLGERVAFRFHCSS